MWRVFPVTSVYSDRVVPNPVVLAEQPDFIEEIRDIDWIHVRDVGTILFRYDRNERLASVIREHRAQLAVVDHVVFGGAFLRSLRASTSDVLLRG